MCLSPSLSLSLFSWSTYSITWKQKTRNKILSKQSHSPYKKQKTSQQKTTTKKHNNNNNLMHVKVKTAFGQQQYLPPKHKRTQTPTATATPTCHARTLTHRPRTHPHPQATHAHIPTGHTRTHTHPQVSHALEDFRQNSPFERTKTTEIIIRIVHYFRKLRQFSPSFI